MTRREKRTSLRRLDQNWKGFLHIAVILFHFDSSVMWFMGWTWTVKNRFQVHILLGLRFIILSEVSPLHKTAVVEVKLGMAHSEIHPREREDINAINKYH